MAAMCGRYSLTSPIEALRQLFIFPELPNLPPRANVAPSQEVPAVRIETRSDEGGAGDGAEDSGRHLAMLRWGLVPGWAKDIKIGYKMINARAETVASNGAFRTAFQQRRCLILADGFYEWRSEDRGGKKPVKQPYRVTLADAAPFAFAGLWEHWKNPETGEPLESCTIITTEANATLAPVHHRMPVILPNEAHAAWLDPASPGADLQRLLAPYPADGVTVFPVSMAVNSVKNDDPSLTEATGPALDPDAPDPLPVAPKQGSLF